MTQLVEVRYGPRRVTKLEASEVVWASDDNLLLQVTMPDGVNEFIYVPNTERVTIHPVERPPCSVKAIHAE